MVVAVGASATQAAVAAAGRGRKMSLPSDLQQQQQQKLLQQVQQDQQQQRQRHHDQQQQLAQQPQHYRPAAAAARELAADLRAQHAVAGAGGALRVPAMPAISSPSLAAPALAPSSPSAAAGHFEHEIPFQELQLGKLLGSGSFGDVFVDPPPPFPRTPSPAPLPCASDPSQLRHRAAAGTAACGAAAAWRSRCSRSALHQIRN